MNFSDKTFSEFFHDDLGVEIDDEKYSVEGASKAKRLRCYLKSSSATEQVRVLTALWNYRARLQRLSGEGEPSPAYAVEFAALLERLGGRLPLDARMAVSKDNPPRMDETAAQVLLTSLIKVSAMPPHERGFAFERFLRDLFDANNLAPRASFRLAGEQIDGSFEFNGETYLLEAKWQRSPVGVADLRSFNAKVEDKAAWSRGLFISECGFSEEGLDAFGRGGSIVCMDGLDLSELLQQGVPFGEALRKKVRRFAETGRPFVRFRDIG